MYVAMWKMLEKAHEEGWKVLIPFYNQYIFHKIAGATKYFWHSLIAVGGIFFAAFLGGFLMALGNDVATIFGALAMLGILALAGYAIYCSVKFCILLARSFGKSGGFAAGLIFLAPIFYCIIAFSSEIRYVGTSGGAYQKKAPSTAYTPAPPVFIPQETVTVSGPAFHRAQLVGKAGAAVNQVIPITATAVLGRSHTADFQINDTTVSSRHCQLSWRGDKLFLTDLGSSNGTSVEGYGQIPANVPVELRNGDKITLSRSNVFEVKM